MSYIEKEKLIKDDIASIENRVRHAFNQGYDLGFKDGKSKQLNCSEIPTGSTTKSNSPKYCDRSICLKNEYNNIGCEDCEVTKSQEPCEDWYDVPSDEMTLEQARQAVKDLRKLFGTTKNDLGVDCISRDEVCRYVAEFVNHEFSTREEEELIDNIITGIEHLPSVTPQEPRKGHWIVAKGGSYLGMRNGCCSNCKDFYTNDWNVMNYCPNCGARMVEPQESEAGDGNDD